MDGISGSALKKDNVAKHSKSDMHVKAMNLVKNKSMSLAAIYKSTPLAKAVASANAEDRCRVSKLFEIAYFIAAEEIPFAKFPALIQLEKRHGVSLGSTYCTANKCSEFTLTIGEAMRDGVVEAMKKSPFLTALIDGSTDSGVVEKELIFISFICN